MAYDSRYILLAVLSLQPDLKVMQDFELAQSPDGTGPMISAWHRTDIAQPTMAQIQAVDTDALVAAQAQVMTQDFLAQLTPSDMQAIQVAISANAAYQLLWSCFLGQQEPMIVGNARFKAGWAALTKILGPARMAAIAAALGITVATS